MFSIISELFIQSNSICSFKKCNFNSTLKQIKLGVTKGSIFGPILYSVCTKNIIVYTLEFELFLVNIALMLIKNRAISFNENKQEF